VGSIPLWIGSWLFAITLALAGGNLLVTEISSGLLDARILSDPRYTEGQIVFANNGAKIGDNSRRFRTREQLNVADVLYTDERGKSFSLEITNEHATSPYVVGRPVELIYNLDDPSQVREVARLNGDARNVTVSVVCLGVSVGAFVLAAYLRQLRFRRSGDAA